MRRNQRLTDAQIAQLLLRDYSESDEGDVQNLGHESDCTDDDFVLEESEGSETDTGDVESSDQESKNNSDNDVAGPSTTHKLTIVGTLRKSKPQIPPSFVNPKGRDAGTSLFAFDKEKTLVSYVPKPKKAVVLLSTMHKNDAIDQETGKPEIITYYNSTKGGVDTFDQLCHTYTTARKTRRWPLRIFYGMLDQAGINAMVLLGNANKAYREDTRNTRRKFLQELSEILVKPHIQKRQEKKFLPTDLKIIMAKVSGEDAPGPVAVCQSQQATPGSKKRCVMCPRKKDKKSALECSHCKKPMCLEHRAMICMKCFNEL